MVPPVDRELTTSPYPNTLWHAISFKETLDGAIYLKMREATLHREHQEFVGGQHQCLLVA